MKIHKAQPSGGTRRARGERVSSSLSEINIIPLVDVMLVLLIIFMVTAPMMQRGLDVSLPVARRAATINAERIFVTIPLSYRTDGAVQIGEDAVPLDVLDERITQVLAGLDQSDVYLRGDAAVTMQELMAVMDKLKEAGVERVGLVTRLPEDR
ncbi:MAG: biopolymer transporter ExbD [Vicinamibacterales bacterium]|jgi:biopolymer transport protein ExbD|nr:protein TolR [Acidobacteriota bacterium]MDP7294795.1 biopolymer transporter ExbD [Vicinamibacterales bacterium]MDP7471392.1 biopolymer transporter ExbD [Vicinamibacterales bacterium]MDP7672242.1 biopolymer transporter ExbD [Vicinamibacterales bacterium]HJO37663.1 biopolymer transporter ExbD [Vicinamibacterales bacterium]|tara:strand:- start:385 stop:843 length:459 start_codon:yes stop_codon:yes gene_type:complete